MKKTKTMTKKTTKTRAMRELDALRCRIDALDAGLVRLLNKRARIAMRIGAIKSEQGLPVRDAGREGAVMARIRALGTGPFSGPALGRLFRSVIEECRALQRGR